MTRGTELGAAVTRVDEGLQVDDPLTAELLERAWAMVPALRAAAREAEATRATPEAIIDLAAEAGLLQALVPRRYGGHGLGLQLLCEVGRILCHGDASMAWTITFLMEHNWMACKLPMATQEELYRDRSYIKAAAPLIPAGSAVPVDGGFRISGKWHYASAIANADYVFVTAPVDEDGEAVPYTFLLPLGDVTVHDEWFMAGMAATSSTNVSAVDLFVPGARAIETEIFHSTDLHPGVVHEESLYRYPLLPPLNVFMAGIALGIAEAVVELGRERLWVSAPWGLARIERETSRTRWGMAHQKVRAARLLWRDAMRLAIAKGEAREEWTQVEEGQVALDNLTVAQMSKEAVREILDGCGSSAYALSNPLQRHLRDVDVVANHLGHDIDSLAERGSRWLLGLDRAPNDPFPPRRTERVRAISEA
jgi:3-hydroxy-9,10-secoandrosta-1,3,5(10)-triene-9,17-dione monooxygenase